VAAVLLVAPPREAGAWEPALQGRGLEVVRAGGGREGRAAAARTPPAVVAVSEKLPFAGALRAIRELRKDPATREVPVVLVGMAPLTVAQRLRLGASAPDATVPPGARPEAVADAIEEALRRGKLPPPELTPAQRAGMKYSRIGNMLMIFGVIFSMPGGGSGAGRSWFVLLIPLGGLVSDYATGRVDGRKKLLGWQGWAALVLSVAMAVGILVWPNFFRWAGPQRSP
jgi:ActR/RegA family two-component response regulator